MGTDFSVGTFRHLHLERAHTDQSTRKQRDSISKRDISLF